MVKQTQTVWVCLTILWDWRLKVKELLCLVNIWVFIRKKNAAEFTHQILVKFFSINTKTSAFRMPINENAICCFQHHIQTLHSQLRKLEVVVVKIKDTKTYSPVVLPQKKNKNKKIKKMRHQDITWLLQGRCFKKLLFRVSTLFQKITFLWRTDTRHF